MNRYEFLGNSKCQGFQYGDNEFDIELDLQVDLKVTEIDIILN